jgi:hypothetical protein
MNPNSDIYPLFHIFPMSKLDNEDFQSESKLFQYLRTPALLCEVYFLSRCLRRVSPSYTKNISFLQVYFGF